MRTLDDVIEECGGLDAVRGGAHPLGRRLIPAGHAGQVLALPHFTCRCGRQVATWMMRDLEPPDVAHGKRLTRVEREALGFGEDRVRCDACCELPVQARRIGAARMREAMGFDRGL